MLRTLRDARAGTFVALDERTGLATPVTAQSAVGVYYELEGVGVSLLVVDGGLRLQIGRESFDAAQIQLCYRHDFEAGTTRFEVRAGISTTALSYPAWWAVLGLSPEQVRFEPERDEDEDFLAFIAQTVNDPERRASFCAQWSK